MDAHQHPVLPDAEYLVLSSRLIPDRDGGFTISVLRRAADMAATGARVRLLTLDPGSSEEHDAHRAELRRRGLLADAVELRNLFDDARADAGWLRSAALPLDGPLPERAGRIVTDAERRPILELPVIVGDPAWHLSVEPVVVWDERGEEPVGTLPGFGGLYRAWINHLRGEPAAPTVVICEARQVGELLVADAVPLLDPDVRVLHTTHACHVLSPFRWDSPMDDTWTRWLGVADRFDGVLWLTASQQRDVERRVGDGLRSAVVPHPVPGGGSNDPLPGRLTVMCSLITRKRVDHAVRALARVRASIPHAELHVYGDGAEREGLERLAVEIGVSHAVMFHGHIPDPGAAWDSTDVFVLTSTNEGQPLVVLEALGHGVPVVSYDLPYGPKDTLAAGGGVLVADGDVEGLAAALVAVAGDRRRRNTLALQARASASRQTSASSMAALGRAVRSALADPVPRPGR